VGKRGIYDGQQPDITELKCIFQVEPINQNVGNFRAANVIMRYLSSLSVRNYNNMEIST